MSTEDNNVIEFPTEWPEDAPQSEMTREEYESAMHELLSTVNEDALGRIIAGVLEFLTMRAIMDGGFYILTDDENAITVFAANEDAKTIRDLLPEHFKSWDDELDQADIVPFETDSDPGDEQVTDEPAS